MDAFLLLEILLHHRDRLRPLSAETDQTRLLQFLVQERRNFVQQKVDAILRLSACLDQYFPQLRIWFGSLDTSLISDLLQHWSTLQQLQKCHPGTLRTFLFKHGHHDEEKLRLRIQLIRAAAAAVSDEVILEAYSRQAQTLVRLIAVLRKEIASFDERIAAVAADHPDAPIFASFPGAGKVTVPRLIVAFGTRRDAYQSAAALQSLSGIAPAKITSGNSTAIRMRHACPKFLRQTFHEFAGQSIPFCPWAKLYYQTHLRGDSQRHHPVVRVLAFKWMRILFHCWKHNELYDESKFLKGQANSPHAAGRELTLLPDPKTGFSKPSRRRK